jgi:hypothetical protein
MKKHKVLILCGGGIMGTIGSYFLNKLNYEFLQDIDTIGGTSIGGIQVCCYSAGASSEDVLNAFIQKGEKIFCKNFINKINPLSIPFYTNKNLKAILKQLTKDKTIGDVRNKYKKLNIVVPTINLTKDTPKVFDNFTGTDDNVKLYDVGLMTSAAPTYFPGIKFKNNCMIDGGLYDVTGLISTVTAIRGKLGIKFEDMDVFVIGAGKSIERKEISFEQYKKYNLIDIAKKLIIPYTTISSEKAAEYWGKNMGFNSFTFYNPIQVKGGLDDTSAVKHICEECYMYEEDFVQKWAKFIDVI